MKEDIRYTLELPVTWDGSEINELILKPVLFKHEHIRRGIREQLQKALLKLRDQFKDMFPESEEDDDKKVESISLEEQQKGMEQLIKSCLLYTEYDTILRDLFFNRYIILVDSTKGNLRGLSNLNDINNFLSKIDIDKDGIDLLARWVNNFSSLFITR